MKHPFGDALRFFISCIEGCMTNRIGMGSRKAALRMHHKNSKDNRLLNNQEWLNRLANVYLTGSELKHESLILAQDERWRRA